MLANHIVKKTFNTIESNIHRDPTLTSPPSKTKALLRLIKEFGGAPKARISK